MKLILNKKNKKNILFYDIVFYLMTKMLMWIFYREKTLILYILGEYPRNTRIYFRFLF